MSNALASAVQLLARREHSTAELFEKLKRKGYPISEIEEALALCSEKGMQSDGRFAESLMRVRVRQGYGPLRIAQELQAKKVSSEEIQAVLSLEHDHWVEYATKVVEKKSKLIRGESQAVMQKLKQFLLYRGFAADTIAKVMQSL